MGQICATIRLFENKLLHPWPGACGSKLNKGVCHTVALAIYIKAYLKAKEELWKLKCFHHAKNAIF
jgi:hypothetical protein